MQIESIEIKNYRLFRHVKLDKLSRLTVLVGANGSGKTTLFDVFSFLKDSLNHNISKAVAKRGGFDELLSRNTKGPISIALKFRETGGRLATYELKVDRVENKTIIEREVLKYRRGAKGQPWKFVDFCRGKGSAITNESVYGQSSAKEERSEFVLESQDILAIKGLGQFKGFKVISDFRNLIENWQISDFHVADARLSQEEGVAEHLSPRGDNIPLVAQLRGERWPGVHFDPFAGFP